MFVLGISTRKLRSWCGELWGAPVSSAPVSRVTQALDYDVDACLRRELEGDIEYLYLDGITAKLRPLGIESKVMLVALGVHRDGTKEVLSLRLEESESAASWEALRADLKRRGLAGEARRMIITDGGPGVIAAVPQADPRIRRQRCLVHASRNVIAKCRMRHKGAVVKGLNAIWETKKPAGRGAGVRALPGALVDRRGAGGALPRDGAQGLPGTAGVLAERSDHESD